jgi:prepilin-type N-terminal cleavage/methylation domain-containing protein
MFNRLQEKRNEGGFTLIELLIVIVILAILAAIVVFAVGTTTTNAVAASCKADAKSVETAVEAYKAQLGTFPPTGIAGVSSLASSTLDGNGNQVGPWLRQVPSSPSYSITLGASGAVSVSTSGAAGFADFDTAATNPCG